MRLALAMLGAAALAAGKRIGRQRRHQRRIVVDGWQTESLSRPLTSLPERRRPVPQPVFKATEIVQPAGAQQQFAIERSVAGKTLGDRELAQAVALERTV